MNANPEAIQKMDADLQLEINSILQKAVIQEPTWNTDYLKEPNFEAKDNELRHQLSANAAEFSAAKTFAEIKEVLDLFKSDAIPKFSDVKRAVLDINDKYNVAHLRTEYNDAVASAQSAAEEIRFQRQKDVMQFATYQTVGDDRVRDRHAELDGLTLPIDHPLWDSINPINGHNCRCIKIQSNDPNKVTPDSAAEAAFDRAKIPMKFQQNPAKTGKAFMENYSHLKNIKPDKLKRSDYHGMKSIDEVYKAGRLSKLGDAVKFNQAWKALKNKRGHKTLDAVILKDGNANLMLVPKKATGNSTFIHQLEKTISKPNEIWLKRNQIRTIKYFDKGIMVVTSTRKGKVTAFKRFDAGDNAVDLLRVGSLMYKR